MKTKLFLLLTFFVMLTQSCSKDPVSTNGTPITKYEYLSAGALNQTPYFTNPAFDTISFASDKGDTLTFVKTKTDSSWYCEKQSFVTDYKICYQTIHNSYTTIKGVGSFDVKHSRKINYKDLTNIIEINFTNLYFSVFDERIGLKDSPFYVDSILFNTNYFYDALYVFHNFTFSDIGKAYCNKKFGLFHIEDKQNITNWTIIN